LGISRRAAGRGANPYDAVGAGESEATSQVRHRFARSNHRKMKTVLLSAAGVGAAVVLGKAIAGGGWDLSAFIAGGVIGGMIGMLLVGLDKVIAKRR
jgi:hypothetical protein